MISTTKAQTRKYLVTRVDIAPDCNDVIPFTINLPNDFKSCEGIAIVNNAIINNGFEAIAQQLFEGPIKQTLDNGARKIIRNGVVPNVVKTVSADNIPIAEINIGRYILGTLGLKVLSKSYYFAPFYPKTFRLKYLNTDNNLREEHLFNVPQILQAEDKFSQLDLPVDTREINGWLELSEIANNNIATGDDLIDYCEPFHVSVILAYQ